MSVATGFDKGVNLGLLLALPLQEGIGLVTYDTAKPHHPIAISGAPVWSSVPSGLGVLVFDGLNDYLDSPAAATVDLDFTAGDYSLAVWFNKVASGGATDMIIGRYALDLDGWELCILDAAGVVQLRHMHSSLAPVRTGCFSLNWICGVWQLLIVTRSGAYPLMYRDGIPIGVTYDAGGLSNPDTANRDLVIGTRYTKNTNWFTGNMWNIRVWNRALRPEEVLHIWNKERWRFGV